MTGATFAIDGDLFRIGDRRYPIANRSNEALPLHTTAGEFEFRRVLLKCESGLALSIIWGSLTYSDNHDHPYLRDEFVEEPRLVEVGVMSHDGLVRVGDEQAVYGYQDVGEVLAILDKANRGVVDPP